MYFKRNCRRIVLRQFSTRSVVVMVVMMVVVWWRPPWSWIIWIRSISWVISPWWWSVYVFVTSITISVYGWILSIYSRVLPNCYIASTQQNNNYYSDRCPHWILLLIVSCQSNDWHFVYNHFTKKFKINFFGRKCIEIWIITCIINGI